MWVWDKLGGLPYCDGLDDAWDHMVNGYVVPARISKCDVDAQGKAGKFPTNNPDKHST